MNEERMNPIELLTTALANMTLTAMEAQRERDIEKERGDDWYTNYIRKENESKELQAMLAAEIKGHEKTRVELEQAIETVEKLSAELQELKKPTIRAQTREELEGA